MVRENYFKGIIESDRLAFSLGGNSWRMPEKEMQLMMEFFLIMSFISTIKSISSRIIRSTIIIALFLIFSNMIYKVGKISRFSDVSKNLIRKQNDYVKTYCNMALEKGLVNKETYCEMLEILTCETDVEKYGFIYMCLDYIKVFKNNWKKVFSGFSGGA